MNTPKRKLVVIRGLPGSGKTTLAKTVYVPQGYKHFEADHYFEDADGNYNFDHSKIGNAHLSCQRKTREALLADHDVVVANTFTTEREIKDYRKIALETDAELIIVNATGKYKSVHNVPEEAMQRMASRWQNIEK